MMVGLRRGQQIDRDEVLPQAGRRAVRAERHRVRSGASSACAAIASSCGRRTRNSPIASSSGATKSSSCRSSIPPAARSSIRQEQLFIYPAKHFVHARGADRRRRRRDQAGTGRAARAVADSQGKLLEAQRLNARTRFDIEMMLEVGYCPGIENYSRPLQRPAAGLDARHALQFLSRRLLAVRRRIARHGAAGARHVRRRLQPQDDAGRARLSPAQRARQPAAEVRRMGSKDQAGDLRLGHAGPVRTGENRRRSRRAGDPPDRACSIR